MSKKWLWSSWCTIGLCINYPLTPIKNFSLVEKCFRLAQFTLGWKDILLVPDRSDKQPHYCPH